MVFFSCDGCGEVLKKSQVDAHAYRCRQCDSVSCADCQVSFYGDDYRQHTSCMTEVERYEKKGPQQQKKKKQTPQEIWMEIVQGSVDEAPGHLKHHMQSIATLDNVPRKPKQFKNFAANSLNIRGKNGDAQLGEIWDFLKAKQEARRQADDQAKAAAATASEKQTHEKPKADDKSSDSHSQPDQPQSTSVKSSSSEKKYSTSDVPASKTKAVKKAMKVALKQAKQYCLSMKDLKKAVRKDMGKDAISKDDAKNLVKQVVSSEQKLFSIEGKKVTLKLKDQ